MVVKPFSQRIDPEKVFAIQNHQYAEKLIMEDTVPANGQVRAKVAISNLGHFFCQYITGSFSTLASPAAALVDTGVNYLKGQLIDGAGQKKLMNEPIPLDLWLSPGRRRDATSTTVLTDPVSNSLFYPIEFEYMFTKNSEIQLDVYNTSDEDNYLEICFHGIRIVSSMSVKNTIGTAGKLTVDKKQPIRRG